MWATIGAIITLVIGPLLALFIKNYIAGQQADKEADNRRSQEETKNRDQGRGVSEETRDVNDSIEKQKDAMNKWPGSNGN